jgi:hypothetical protein
MANLPYFVAGQSKSGLRAASILNEPSAVEFREICGDLQDQI